MFYNFGISRIREFINAERVYVLMLAFILLLNAWLIFAEKMPQAQEDFLGKKVFSLRSSKEAVEETEVKPKAYADISWEELLGNKTELLILNIVGFLGLFVFALGLFLDIRILMAVRSR